MKKYVTLLHKYLGSSNRKSTKTKKRTPEKQNTGQEKLADLVSAIGKHMFDTRVKIEWGKCPHCELITQMMSTTKNYYRCIKCEEVVRQYVNGCIKYLPMNTHSLRR
tara:strand:- start:215 stop:535 length:321 start_codon:yes stop_codon:yes gene_type:complete